MGGKFSNKTDFLPTVAQFTLYAPELLDKVVQVLAVCPFLVRILVLLIQPGICRCFANRQRENLLGLQPREPGSGWLTTSLQHSCLHGFEGRQSALPKFANSHVVSGGSLRNTGQLRSNGLEGWEDLKTRMRIEV